MLRRLYQDQPESFAFTHSNLEWAKAQISKYPEGRQASAIIPLLWRAQEQEGWLSRPAIETVADMLGMAYIRALEVASFYFMFQLQPVGTVAHFQICGTTSCMICGAEDLIGVCREKIAANPHELSADGKFSWEEVECLGACANAPMAQIGKDYYEDLTADRFAEMIDSFASGQVPVPGPQNGRFTSEPLSGLTSLKEFDSGHTKYNASVQLAVDIGDTVKRIDGTEVPLLTPWRDDVPTPSNVNDASASKPEGTEAVSDTGAAAKGRVTPSNPLPGQDELSSRKGSWKYHSETTHKGETAKPVAPLEVASSVKPAVLEGAKDGTPDDLKLIKGVGPKLESLLNSLGVYHFDQIASWSEAEVAWVDENLEGFKGRVTRDGWVSQAKELAEGVETEFSKRVKKDGIYDE